MDLHRLNKYIVSLVLLNLGEQQQQSKPLWRKRWHGVFLLTCSKGVLLRCAYFSICVPIEIPNVVVSCSYFISEVSCVCVILTLRSCVACSKSVQKFMFELMFDIHIWFFFLFHILLSLSNEARSSSHFAELHQLRLWLGEIRGKHLCQLSTTMVNELKEVAGEWARLELGWCC